MRVVDAIDIAIYDVSIFIGRSGTVSYLNYDCDCGQCFPGDPMIGVEFGPGETEEFWPEELTIVTPPTAG